MMLSVTPFYYDARLLISVLFLVLAFARYRHYRRGGWRRER